MPLTIGVDVGGTNTDAVILKSGEVLSWSKQPTTPDITSGVIEVIKQTLKELPTEYQPEPSKFVSRVNIGTTHFVNAVIQRKGLAPVAVLRLCGPASLAVPPFCDFPSDLRQVIGGKYHFLNGGFQYDKVPITDIDEEEVKRVAKHLEKDGIKNVVIAGIFSPACADQEVEVAAIINRTCPCISITLSHEVGLVGLLERENAAILNETLKPLCGKTVAAFRKALHSLGLVCPFYLTQNDGTIISSSHALQFPVFTFASGPTNSMRGAAFLSHVQNAIVIDIGGTSTDVGVLTGGFPRQASTRVKIGGVNTNFRMPDVLSVGLGGGSLVHEVHRDDQKRKVKVGPLSVGYKLSTEALVFGGKSLTATDIAVAAGLCDIAGMDQAKVGHLDREYVAEILDEIKHMIECTIDQVKLSGEDLPVILVGGGVILIDKTKKLAGASEVVYPPCYQVANAVGAALSKVSGTVDYVISMAGTTREKAYTQAKHRAQEDAIKLGADPDSLEVIDKMEVPLAYLPGNAMRYYLRVVGNLSESNTEQCLADYTVPGELLHDEEIKFSSEADVDASRRAAVTDVTHEGNQSESAQRFPEPRIDPDTGDWILSAFDVECIHIGAGIMGCGGGGSPYVGRLSAMEALKAGKEIRVIHPDKLGTSPELTGLVSVVAFMGAPAILVEKLSSAHEKYTVEALMALVSNEDKQQEVDTEEGVKTINNIQALMSEKKQPPPDKKVIALMSAEIGGANSFVPIVVGAELGLPVVDADGMGRAFPELQMFLPCVYGCAAHPAAIADESVRVTAVSYADSAKTLENFFRKKTVELGCIAGIAEVFTLEEIQRTCVKFSLSRTWRLGNAVLLARKNKTPPVDTILQHENGHLLITGKVADVSRKTKEGFDIGTIKIEGSERYGEVIMFIKFQNENYLAYVTKPDGANEVLATVPDLISLVDVDTGEPITTEEVRYGLRVAVLAMSCSPLWTSPEGLAVVGPDKFGFKGVAYKPIGTYVDHAPIPRA